MHVILPHLSLRSLLSTACSGDMTLGHFSNSSIGQRICMTKSLGTFQWQLVLNLQHLLQLT
jgi:hypothetical protein